MMQYDITLHPQGHREQWLLVQEATRQQYLQDLVKKMVYSQGQQIGVSVGKQR